MIRWLRSSLVARGGLALAAIALIALLNILASVIVANKTQGDAAAINMAGSLRMQSYKLAYLLQLAPSQEHRQNLDQEIDVMSDRLRNTDLVQVLNNHKNDNISLHYEELVHTWHARIQPTLLDRNINRLQLRTFYDGQVDGFVDRIDSMVRLLQRDTEAKIRLLMIIQGASMFLTVVVVFVAMLNLNTSIVAPLRRLVHAAEQIRSGNLVVSLDHDIDDELGQLAKTFNQMSQELSRMYGDLERKVTEKTAALLRSNQSLQLMYNASRKLAVSPYSHSILAGIIEDLIETTGVRNVSLCLKGNAQQQHADDCHQSTIRQANFSIDVNDSSPPVCLNQNRFGILFVETEPDTPLAPWQCELFTAVSDTIATALSLEKKSENENRLMLAEERAAIARDLHDSLAQSLSYLKFQIGRWKILQARSASHEQLNEVVEDIREGLNSAYKQLRELLATFRLKVDEPGLEAALKGTIAEFSQRGELEIRLDYGLQAIKLTPNEEIHLLHIIRESLSNVVKHAQATEAKVSLTTQPNQQVIVTIDDDGVGLPNAPQKQHHYGLAIMKERASQLHAELLLTQSPQGGTRVQLECRLENIPEYENRIQYV